MGKKDKKSEKPEDSLYGSSLQPATFELEDGTILQLGEVVRQAYEDSEAETADAWNALSDEAREAMIRAVVEKLPLKKTEVETAPDLTGLVKMKKDGKTMHANPAIVPHHESNGWKVA
jgi:hypothetical protein